MGREPTSHPRERHRTDQHPGRGAGARKRRRPDRRSGREQGAVPGQPAWLMGTFRASAVTVSPSGFGSTLRTLSWNGSSGSGTSTEMPLA